MSDMGDMYREMREEKQKRHHENWMRDSDLMKDDKWTEHTVHHYSKDLSGGRLQYWPSSNKWHFRGKVHHGSYAKLQEFIARNP